MRISKVFKASFAGALIFSPAMAQQAGEVHEQAQKVLREQLASGATNASTPAISSPSQILPVQPSRPAGPGDEAARLRGEREARMAAEAQRRMTERDRLQEERRKQFEEYVKERERLRDQQRSHEETAARQAGQIRNTRDIHSQAQEILRGTPTGGSATASQEQSTPATPVNPAGTPAAESSPDEVQQRALEIIRERNVQSAPPSTPPVTEADLAPRVTATPGQNIEDIHSKAQEVLRQQMQTAGETEPAGTTEITPAPAAPERKRPEPSPYLKQRLQEIDAELNNPVQRPQSNQTIEPSANTEAYARELEARALQRLSGASPSAADVAASAAPAAQTITPRLDDRTREMIERQDREVSRQSTTVVPSANRPSPYARPGMSPEAEQRAREVLRQQQSAVASQTPAVTAAPAQAAQAPGATAATDTGPGYSRELEERARQILLNRAQAQQGATTAPAVSATTPGEGSSTKSAAPSGAAAVQPGSSATPSGPGSAASAEAPANIEQIHSEASRLLHQVQPGEGSSTVLKSKRDRLRVLTDLYMQDKMTPSEYHQRRAAILAEPDSGR